VLLRTFAIITTGNVEDGDRLRCVGCREPALRGLLFSTWTGNAVATRMWNLRKIKEREQAAQTDKTVSPEHVNQHISKEGIMAETGRYRADCRASDRRTNRVRRTRQSSGDTSGIGAGANTGYRVVVREPDEFCREQW